jgi:hypothetical protein
MGEYIAVSDMFGRYLFVPNDISFSVSHQWWLLVWNVAVQSVWPLYRSVIQCFYFLLCFYMLSLLRFVLLPATVLPATARPLPPIPLLGSLYSLQPCIGSPGFVIRLLLRVLLSIVIGAHCHPTSFPSSIYSRSFLLPPITSLGDWTSLLVVRYSQVQFKHINLTKHLIFTVQYCPIHLWETLRVKAAISQRLDTKQIQLLRHPCNNIMMLPGQTHTGHRDVHSNPGPRELWCRIQQYIRGILMDWVGFWYNKRNSLLGIHYISATAAFYHRTWLYWPQIHPKCFLTQLGNSCISLFWQLTWRETRLGI